MANVAIWGQRDKQYQVLVDPDRLRASGVTLEQVTRATQDATVLESGGYVDKPNQRLAVRHRAMVRDPDDLARSVVAFPGNAPVRLSDVARVQFGSPPPIGDAIINDGPGLLLIVEKQPWGNTVEITQAVDAALAELRATWHPNGLVHDDVKLDNMVWDPATRLVLTDWELVDYGDVIVHVFTDEMRAYYEIERLYRDVPRLDWRAEAAAG